MNKESIVIQLRKLAELRGICFEEEELSEAVEMAQFRIFPKGYVIRSVGDKAEEVAVVLNGLVRSYYIDGDGNDITRGFAFNGGMCIDEGVVGYEEHICVWETLEEATLMIFNVRELKHMIMSIESLKKIWIELLENGLRYKIYRENGFLLENAAERYLHFRKLDPELCSRVPQKHIATYLGITPESLSRIRKVMKEEQSE